MAPVVRVPIKSSLGRLLGYFNQDWIDDVVDYEKDFIDTVEECILDGGWDAAKAIDEILDLINSSMTDSEIYDMIALTANLGDSRPGADQRARLRKIAARIVLAQQRVQETGGTR